MAYNMWQTIDQFRHPDLHPVIVAVPAKHGGWPVRESPWIVGEAYRHEGEWWWAGGRHDDYFASPIVDSNEGPPRFWQDLPAPPAAPCEVSS